MNLIFCKKKEHSFDLVEISYENLQKGQYAIWCGAGISFSSGLPTAKGLINKIIEFTNLSTIEKKYVTDLVLYKIPFERLIESLFTIMDDVAQKQFLQIFEKGQPSIFHNFIAQLALEKKVKLILTTNFDTLIEEALNNRGIEFIVYNEFEKFDEINWDNNNIKVIKLHGCIQKPEELAITVGCIAKPGSVKYVQNPVKHILSKGIHEGILIFGYSFSDRFDISPVINTFRKDNESKQIINFEYTYPDDEFTCGTYKHNTFHFLRGYEKGEFIKGDIELFIERLSNKFDFKAIKREKYPNEWANYLDEFFQKLYIKNYKILWDLISGILLNLVGAHNESIAYFEKVLELIPTNAPSRFKLVAMQNIANSYIRSEKIIEAQKILTKAITIADEIEDGKYSDYALQQLSTVYYQLGDICTRKSLQLSNAALDIASKQSNPELRMPHLSSIASCWMKLGDFDAAAKAFSVALSISSNSVSFPKTVQFRNRLFIIKSEFNSLKNKVLFFAF